jgi:hypothetical protein
MEILKFHKKTIREQAAFPKKLTASIDPDKHVRWLLPQEPATEPNNQRKKKAKGFLPKSTANEEMARFNSNPGYHSADVAIFKSDLAHEMEALSSDMQVVISNATAYMNFEGTDSEFLAQYETDQAIKRH